ncbi:MAG: sigma-70 family RNA polymerase sigma factor [Polyangiaceae bacterium]
MASSIRPQASSAKGGNSPRAGANGAKDPKTPAERPVADGESKAGDVGSGANLGPAGDLPAPERARRVNTAMSEASKEQRAREAEEDRALIAKAQSSDGPTRAAAFRQLVERHQRRAFAIAFGLVRDEHDAHEIVQEAFLRVYKGIASFEGSSSFFTWLYRIVTNLAIDLMRKPGRKSAELDESRSVEDEADAPLALVSRIDGADPVDVIRRREIAKRIQTALDALPHYHRAVILMREVEGMSYEEMASAMNVSKGTIMSRLFHARQKMQKALSDCYQEQGYVARGALSGDVPSQSEDEESQEEEAP